MLTHKNIVWNAFASSKIPDFNANDRMLSILPLAHVYECTLGLVIPIMCGSSVYYVKKPPTAAVLLPALEMVKPTAMLTVPLIIEKMYKTRILPEIKKRFLVRLIYKFPVIRKRIHKIAGVQIERNIWRCDEIFWNRRCSSCSRSGTFPARSGISICYRLWIDRNITAHCRSKCRKNTIQIHRALFCQD